MSGDYCRGCGSVIQTKNPGGPGYVPEISPDRRGPLVCQRCYRITHYGEAGALQPDLKQVRQSINKAIQSSELLVVVADLTDLTGSLLVWAEFLAGKPYVLAVNKSDLLPGRTEYEEVRAYLKNYLTTTGMEAPAAVLLVSGLKGGGVDVLGNRLKALTASGSKIAFLGVTNVGKSSLIKRFLTMEKSNISPTISKFPGTTMGLSNWSIFRSRNTLIDTPGLVPGNRLGDLLCPQCAGQLISMDKIEQKLWGLKPGKGIIVGGLLGIEPSGHDQELVMIVFTSPEFGSHRTDNSKIRSLLDESPSWLSKICQGCRGKIDWQEETVHMEPNFDLAVAGLGWISLRGQASDFKITLPKGVRWEVRPALVGKR
jgi:30S ribosome assembly GTPase